MAADVGPITLPQATLAAILAPPCWLSGGGTGVESDAQDEVVVGACKHAQEQGEKQESRNKFSDRQWVASLGRGWEAECNACCCCWLVEG